MDLALPTGLTSAHRALLTSTFDRIETRYGPELLGLVLSGSAGRGRATEHSDVDLYVVLDGDAPAPPPARSHDLDELPIRLLELQAVPAFGSAGWGYRWSFAWAPVLLDRAAGAVRDAVERQAVLSPEEADGVLIEHGRLDGWVNLAYRALKSDRAGRAREARLDAAESVPWLLDVVFACAGRVRPHNGYLLWELAEHPVPGVPSADLASIVERLLDGDPGAVRDAFALVAALMHVHDADPVRASGAAVLDGWGDDLALLRRPTRPV